MLLINKASVLWALSTIAFPKIEVIRNVLAPQTLPQKKKKRKRKEKTRQGDHSWDLRMEIGEPEIGDFSHNSLLCYFRTSCSFDVIALFLQEHGEPFSTAPVQSKLHTPEPSNHCHGNSYLQFCNLMNLKERSLVSVTLSKSVRPNLTNEWQSLRLHSSAVYQQSFHVQILMSTYRESST